MGFGKFSVLLGAAITAAVVSAGSAQAAPVALGSDSLADILANHGGQATVANLLFTFAPYSPVTGAPTAAQIQVTAFSTVSGEPGIALNSNWTDPNPNSILDSSIAFTVATTDGSLINDDYLAVSGAAPSTSSWQVDETVSPANGGSLTINETSGNTSTDPTTAIFAPVALVHVTKDILLTNTTATPTITTIDQGFSTVAVPVPDAAWMGLSTLLGAGCIGAIRKRLRIA